MNPPINKRTITTKLLIQDQTIVVIGGVFTQDFQEAKSQTPFLGDIPLIGHLFKRVEKNRCSKRDLNFPCSYHNLIHYSYGDSWYTIRIS